MKTIVDTNTNQSKYVFHDATVVTVCVDKIETPTFIIGDMNTRNAVVFENVVPPTDWVGCKYLYANGEWTLDPNWAATESGIAVGSV